MRAALFPAMEAGADLEVRGNVSSSLLDNLETYQQIIHRWWPGRYRPVTIRPDAEVAAGAAAERPGGREALLTFSGGLDSCYSLYCHKKGLRGRNTREIPWCVMVHGFDIPVKDRAFRGAVRRAQAIVESLGARLFTVRTNLKRMLPSWDHCHPAAVTAVLSLFQRRYSVGLIAGTYAYGNPFAFWSDVGSTPLSDPLLSSDSFRIVHDGADSPRVGKCQILGDWEAARRNVRVCWAGNDLSTNCGKCRKCILVMLCMRAAGMTDFRAFETPLTAEKVRSLQPGTPGTLEEVKAGYAVAEAARADRRDLPQAVARPRRLMGPRQGLLSRRLWITGSPP